MGQLAEQLVAPTKPFVVIATRYKNAYAVSHSIRGVGEAYRWVSILTIAAGMVGAAYVEHILYKILAAVLAVIMAGILFATGMLLQAIGEAVNALLDTAVNTRAAAEKAWEP